MPITGTLSCRRMRPWILALAALVALPLSGCLNGAAPDDVVVETAPHSSLPELPAEIEMPTFGAALLLGQPRGYGIGGEPSVVAAEDGTLFVSAPIISYIDLATGILGGGFGQGRIWRSDDGGATFTLLNRADGRLTDEGRGNGDTDIAVDGHGNVHFVDLGGGVPYLRSEDGLAFTYEGELNEDGRPVDRQWVDARGDLVVATWAAQDGDPRGISFTRSTDSGLSWSEPVDLVEDMIQLGPVVLGPNGGVLQPYVQYGSKELRMLASHDDGLTWQDVEVGRKLTTPCNNLQCPWSPTAIFPVAAFDSAGNALLVWSEYRDDGSTSLWHAFSTDGGLTWREPAVLIEEGNTVLPWVSGGDAGRFAISFVHAASTGDPNTGVHRWFLQSIWMFFGERGISAQAVSVQDEPVHIGSICPHGGGCGLGNVAVRSDRTLLDFFETDITPDGQLVLAWTQTSPEGARNPEVRFARQTGGSPLLDI
jgi:hypothetical protein